MKGRATRGPPREAPRRRGGSRGGRRFRGALNTKSAIQMTLFIVCIPLSSGPRPSSCRPPARRSIAIPRRCSASRGSRARRKRLEACAEPAPIQRAIVQHRSPAAARASDTYATRLTHRRSRLLPCKEPFFRTSRDRFRSCMPGRATTFPIVTSRPMLCHHRASCATSAESGA